MSTNAELNSRDFHHTYCLLTHPSDKEVFLALVNTVAALGEGKDAVDIRNETGYQIEDCILFEKTVNTANAFLAANMNCLRPRSQ